MKLAISLTLAVAAVLVSCVKAPNVSVVDSKTALERQAAGEYRALENDLEQAGLTPSGEPIPREDLIPTSGEAGNAALGEVAQLYAKVESDSETIDRLLRAKCVGEATNGFLEPRPAECTRTIDTAEMTRVLGRENLHRRQIWQLIASETQSGSLAAVRTRWRAVHLERVVCGGLVQDKAKIWKPKSC